MAIIRGGGIVGELSGKMGGFVFAHNKAGAYVRRYAMPVNPNTVAQGRARSAFAQAVLAYHALTPTQKGMWNSFASQYFTPQSGNYTASQSGFAAFVSLRNVLMNSIELQTELADLGISVNGTPATVITQQSPVLPDEPPPGPQSSELQGYIIQSASATYVASTNVVTINLNFIGAGGPGPGPAAATTSILRDSVGYRVGFSVFLSNQLVQAGTFVQNPKLLTIGTTGIIQSYTTSSEVTSTMTISFEPVIDFDDYKSGILEGGGYRLGVEMFNSVGQRMPISSNFDTV